jgi:hypothetical protein
MNKRVLATLASAALVPAALFSAAAPASAQAWRTPARSADIHRDIDGLRWQIDRAQQRRAISGREADGLRREARAIQQQYGWYARGGLSRTEHAALERRVVNVRSHLRLERWDRDGRRG